MRLSRHEAGFAALILVVGFAMTATAMFPLENLPDTHGDMGQNVWNFHHAAESLAEGKNPYEAPDMFYPIGAHLGATTSFPGFAPITLAVRTVTGGHPLYAMFTYKLVIILCCLLRLAVSFLFVRVLGFSRWPALLAALGFTFCNAIDWPLIYPNHQVFLLLPLCAWLLVRAARKPKATTFAALAFVYGYSLYLTELFPHIALGALVFGVVFILFRSGRLKLSEVAKNTSIATLAVGGAVLLATTALPIGAFLAAEKLVPGAEHAPHWSSNLAGMFLPDAQTNPVFGPLVSNLEGQISLGVGGEQAYIGIIFLLAALLGAWRGKVLERASLATGAVFFFISLGPSIQVFATDTGIPTLFNLMTKLPVLEHIRTPTRFSYVGMFFWMIPAAAGFQAVFRAVRERFGRAMGVVALVGLSVLVFADTYTPFDRYMHPPPDISALQTIEDGGVINLPLELRDGVALYAQTIHNQPIATGYTSRQTEDQVRLLTFLEHSLWFDLDSLAEYIEEYDFRTFLVSAPIPAVLRHRLSELPMAVVDWGDTGGDHVVASHGRLDGVGLAPSAWTDDDRFAGDGRLVTLTHSVSVRQVDLLADGEMSFRVTLLFAGESVAETLVPTSLLAGLRWRAVAVEAANVDQIVVEPEVADVDTAVRALVLVD